MATPEHVLNKIKLLRNLGHSSNQNESDTAKTMADNLINKYGVSDEELKSLEDKKPLYGEDEKLFSTIGLEGWRQQLALAIGKHFYCLIIQEEVVPTHGLHEFNYYVYGDPEDAFNVKFVYYAFIKKVEQLIEKKCVGRGPIYVSSYSEGVVEAIKNNIYWNGIDIPDIKQPSRPIEDNVLNNGQSNLSVHKEEKEKPVQESVNISSQSLIKDINAYFKGLEDGKEFSLNEILELAVENERVKEIQAGQEKAGGVSEVASEESEHPTQQGSAETSEGRKNFSGGIISSGS